MCLQNVEVKFDCYGYMTTGRSALRIIAGGTDREILFRQGNN